MTIGSCCSCSHFQFLSLPLSFFFLTDYHRLALSGESAQPEPREVVFDLPENLGSLSSGESVRECDKASLFMSQSFCLREHT